MDGIGKTFVVDVARNTGEKSRTDFFPLTNPFLRLYFY